MAYAVATLIASPAVAHAAPGDLDAAFGTDGVARVAGVAQAQAGPVVSSGGRITALGLSDGRLTIARRLADGRPDTSFGGGTVVTGYRPVGRGSLAVDSLGRVVIAVGTGSDKITFARYLPSGARDLSFGDDDDDDAGQIVSKGVGSLAYPTRMRIAVDGKIVVGVANASNDGRKYFTVIRITDEEPDDDFGDDGVAKSPVGSDRSQVNDVALLPDGSVLAVGTAGAKSLATSADAVIARFTPAGKLDKTYAASGVRRLSITGQGPSQSATGIAAADDGAATIVGTTGPGAGFAARLKPSGSLDTSFASAGLLTDGLGLSASAVIGSGAGPVVVAGTGRTGATTTWAVAALRADGTLDPGFGTGGRTTVPSCDSAGQGTVVGATGTGSAALVAGSCTDDDGLAVAKVITREALPGPAELAVTPRAGASGHERIRLSRLDPSSVFGSTNALQSIAARSSSVLDVAARSSGDPASAAARSSAARSSVLTLLQPSPTLSAIAARSSGGWPELLRGTVLEDVPLTSVTIEQVFALDPLPSRIAGLTLGDLDLDALRSIAARSSAARSSTLSAFVLSVAPLAKLPAPPGGWCAYLAGMPLHCGNGVSPATTTLFELEHAGDDLAAYYRQPLSLKAPTDISGTTLAAIRLENIAIERTVLADVPASELDGLATVGELAAALPLPHLDDLSLGQVLAGIVPPQEIPYERIALDRLFAASDVRSDGLQTATATFRLDCGLASGLRVALTLPDHGRVVPGSATIAAAGDAPRPVDDPARDGDVSTFSGSELDGVCRDRSDSSVVDVELRAEVEPGVELGTRTARVTITTGSDSSGRTASAPVEIDDSNDPPSDGSRRIGADALVTGHLTPGDTDTYSIDAPAVGSRVTVTLSHLPADYDLVIRGAQIGVDTSAARSSAARSSAARSSLVLDASGERTDPGVLSPDSVQDIAARSSAARSSSINRGTADESATVVIRPEDAGGTLRVSVVGYNGASSDEKYVLRTATTPGSSPLPCHTPPSLQSAGAGVFPSLPASSDRQTLILVNRRRMAAQYGASATDAMLTRLGTYAARSDVRGVVVPVEAHPTLGAAVDDAYARWDENRCSSTRIGNVVAEINRVVDDVRKGLPDLRSIVLVGPHQVLPQAPIPDTAELSNESEYADDAAFDGKDNEVSRVLRDGNLLSDAPYGDFDPQQTDKGRRIYVPDVALGRLLETPGEVVAQVDRYLEADGILDPASADVSGYDFLSDGSAAVAAPLRGLLGSTKVRTEINETWDDAYALGVLNAAEPRVSSLNAHYNHMAGLPAAAFNANGSPNLFHATQASPAPGSLAFTMGCHAGLGIADILVQTPTAYDAERVADWPQRFAQRRSTYVANTGFGYGDTDVVAYSESLMSGFATELASGRGTVGQSFGNALRRYVSEFGETADEYHYKALHVATFYGLPTYRVGSSGISAPAVLPPTGNGEGSTVSTPFDVSPTFQAVDGPRGRTYQVPGERMKEIVGRPIQPRISVPLPRTGNAPAHGFLIEGLETEEIPDVDVPFGQPTVDLSANEPENAATSTIFPVSPGAIVQTADASGRKETLDLSAGQFRLDTSTGARGTQALYKRIRGRVLRSTSADWEPPIVLKVNPEAVPGLVSFRVDLEDTDATGGVALYRTDADATWHSVNLAVAAPRTVSGGQPLPAGATYVKEWQVQVRDAAGNVGRNAFKGQLVPRPSSGTVTIRLNPEPGASGYLRETPQVTIDPGDLDAEDCAVSVNGGAYEPYRGPFVPDPVADGANSIDVRCADGSTGRGGFILDTEGPQVTGEPTTAANAFGWYRADVTVRFRCADEASGVATCPPDALLTGEGRNLSVNGTATDRAGNSGSGTVSGIDIDRTQPTGQVVSRGVVVGQAITGTAADALSGIDAVTVTYTPYFGGTSVQRTATVSCSDGSRTSCTWSAATPGAGVYTARATITDRAGNTGQSEAAIISVGG